MQWKRTERQPLLYISGVRGGAVSAEEWQKTMYKYISIQMKLKLAELEQFSL